MKVLGSREAIPIRSIIMIYIFKTTRKCDSVSLHRTPNTQNVYYNNKLFMNH